MTIKTLTVPKFLHELHGERANLLNFVLVYVVGVLTAIISMLELIPKNIELWKLIVVFLLFTDITGGVISNMSFSTNNYYQKRPKLKMIFIFAHIIQPLLFSIMFIEYWPYMLFIYLLTMVSCFILYNISNKDIQRTIGSVFIIIGIVGTIYLFDFELLSIMLIGILYMLKLILGFSVNKDS